MTLLRERFAEIGPLAEMEGELARAAIVSRGRLPAEDETTLRYALSLARAWHVRAPDGSDVAVAELLRPFREQLARLLWPLFEPARRVHAEPAELVQAARAARALTQTALREVERELGHRLPAAVLDREVRTRQLVLVCGGGGGTGYVHLAAFALLEAAGLQPALIAGSSMGAILGLFRAREKRFDLARIPEILADLSYRKIFRLVPQQSVYGLPGPLRLHLRAAIGHWFQNPDGSPVRLSDLPIPLLVTVAGIRRGKLPRPLEEYERIFGKLSEQDPSRWSFGALHQSVQRLTAAISELARIPRLASRLVFGAGDETRKADAIDAAGFSASVPGLIHYEVLRDDPRMKALLDGLLARHDLLRLCDGGIIDNVPVRSAWQHVQRVGLAGGGRNAVIFALDSFAPRLLTPLWLPLQSVAAPAVARNRAYAHIYKAFRRTLSPLSLLPSQRSLDKVIRSAKEELLAELPVLQRLLAPIGPLPAGSAS